MRSVILKLARYVSRVKSCRRKDKQTDKAQQVKKLQCGVVLCVKKLFEDLHQGRNITSKYQKKNCYKYL